MAKRKKATDLQPIEGQLPSNASVSDQEQLNQPLSEHQKIEASDPATEFDPAKLEAKHPISSNTLDQSAKSSHKPVEQHPRSEQFSSKLPDPHSIEQISLSAERDGAMMRLFRNHRFRSMAIKFDEKPPAEITQQLRDTGWEWRSQEKVWVKPLERGNEWRIAADAEKQFRAIGNKLREIRGLEPVAQLGVGAA